jgi:amino acid transporter
VVMSYVEVFGARHAGVSLASMTAPLTEIAKAYNVTYFKIPVAMGAMVSFFSLTLSCLNAGSRIVYPMAQHTIFPGHLGRTHRTNQTPHVAITVFIAVMVTIPIVLEVFTNPLTTFGDAGTLAAFGFLTAYFLISFAAPVYLHKRGELRARNVVITVLAGVFLLVPTIGSFYPVPPFPVDVFPYIFLGYMVFGSAWLFVVSRRRRGVLGEIEMDLEASMLSSAKHTDEVDVALELEPSVPVAVGVPFAEPIPAKAG